MKVKAAVIFLLYITVRLLTDTRRHKKDITPLLHAAVSFLLLEDQSRYIQFYDFHLYRSKLHKRCIKEHSLLIR